MSSTLLAISWAVDGVRGRLFNPSHLRLPCASIGYSGSALQRACEELGLPQRCCALAATMEEDGALEHSLAFAGIAKNSAGDIYKNGLMKPFEEKAGVAQMWIDMTGADPHRMHDGTNDALNVYHAGTNSIISTEIIKALYSMI